MKTQDSGLDNAAKCPTTEPKLFNRSSIVILRRLNWRQFERLACFEDIKPVVGILSEMETIE